MKKLKLMIVGSIFLTSCGVGNLTTQQKNEIIKINKQIDDLWNEHYYKIDKLYIKKDSIIKHKNKLKECCIKTANEVYKYEGMYANQEWDEE